VPKNLEGVIDIGDIGVVVEKYDEDNFEIECVTPDGSYKWLEKLNRRYISKQLQTSTTRKVGGTDLMQRSITLGTVIGITFGGLMGAGLGAITMNLNGILVGMVMGLILGIVIGPLTATVKTAGTTGGIGTGYFTGMIFGGLFGFILGALLPTSLTRRAHTEGLPVLDALVMGHFATAVLTSFLLSILSTIVGVWVGAKNHVPRNLK
jgi:ABC-type microcin C transport system permease subunit YejE